MMPYLMPRRNESLVFHDMTFRIPAARAWLKAYNRCHQPRATMFHLLAYACAGALHARPLLNRFVSGGRIYQRRGVQLSFVAKKEMTDAGVGATVKLEAPPGEDFAAFSARMERLVGEARSIERAVDREVGLIMRLPGPVVGLLVRLARWLDRWNLFPRFMTRNDPMYASVFLANLGSVGISDVYHHLYEYGTVSIFGAMSAPRHTHFVEHGRLVVDEGLQVRWTFDERIADGFVCSRSLRLVQRAMEHPERWFGPAEGTPHWQPPDLGEAA